MATAGIEMTKNTTLFYSWQSDTPSNLNRAFIQKALENAIQILKADANVEPALRAWPDSHCGPTWTTIRGPLSNSIGCSAVRKGLSPQSSLAIVAVQYWNHERI